MKRLPGKIQVIKPDPQTENPEKSGFRKIHCSPKKPSFFKPENLIAKNCEIDRSSIQKHLISSRIAKKNLRFNKFYAALIHCLVL